MPSRSSMSTRPTLKPLRDQKNFWKPSKCEPRPFCDGQEAPNDAEVAKATSSRCARRLRLPLASAPTCAVGLKVIRVAGDHPGGGDRRGRTACAGCSPPNFWQETGGSPRWAGTTRERPARARLHHPAHQRRASTPTSPGTAQLLPAARNFYHIHRPRRDAAPALRHSRGREFTMKDAYSSTTGR